MKLTTNINQSEDRLIFDFYGDHIVSSMDWNIAIQIICACRKCRTFANEPQLYRKIEFALETLNIDVVKTAILNFIIQFNKCNKK